MKFKFDSKLTYEEYLLFRKFCLLKYGKKARILTRITLCLLGVVVLWLFFKAEGFTTGSIFCGCVFSLWIIVWLIILKPYLIWCMKKRVAKDKKKGKKLYSNWFVMEFYDDFFTDTSESVKCEVKYFDIETVSIVENTILFLHGNNGIIYILPLRTFETKEQYDAFIEFIKTKCPKIDFYDKI